MPPCLRGENSSPLLIVRTIADRQVILSLSAEAAAFGIRAGMTLTQARALCAHVGHAEHEPARDTRALEALARWLMRFSPVVSIMPCDESSMQQAIFLDLTGCGRLFDGLPNLVGKIDSALSRMGLTARMAVAPTVGAAWALAEAGKNGAIVLEEELAAVLAPLPPAALRLSAGLVAALRHLGLATIQQVAALPRDVLPARFGKELLLRLDQAMGNIAEPLAPLEHHAPVQTKMDFDGPISSLEAIHAVSRHLLQQVIAQLTHRGCGARQLDIELTRAYAPPLKKTISLSHPSRDMKSLFNLMACLWEDKGDKGEGRRDKGTKGQKVGEKREGRRDEGTKGQRVGHAAFSPFVSSSLRPFVPSSSFVPSPSVYGDGYTSFSIRVPLLQRLTEEQIFLLEQEQHASRLEVGRLIDRLRLRLGEEGIVSVKLLESHLPEKAWAGIVGENGVEGEGNKGRRDKGTKGEETGTSPGPSVSSSPFLSPTLGPFVPSSLRPFSAPYSSRCTLPSALTRPLHLFPCPQELRVIVTPSDAIEGMPAAFVYEHQVHRVIHCAGPERIAGIWWEGHCKTRDYFEVEIPTGQRFWIFRVSQTSKWYLQGAYV